MLPSQGRCLAIFLLGRAAHLKTRRNLKEWIEGTDAIALKVKQEFDAKEKARLTEKQPTKTVARAQPEPAKKTKAA